MKRRRLRGCTATRREKLDCLNLLAGSEALSVLRELLSSYPDLLPDAKRAANALLAKVSVTDVAKNVFDALLALDLDDLDAGPRASGYVEPSKAAWELIERALEPFRPDLSLDLATRSSAQIGVGLGTRVTMDHPDGRATP